MIEQVIAYVAGPYRDPRGVVYVRQNIRNAEMVALALWRMHIPTICPHLNTALFDGAAEDHVWLEGDLLILGRCDLVVTVPGWQRSKGSRGELQLAAEMDLPVFHAYSVVEGRCVLPEDEIRRWLEERKNQCR